MLELKEGLKENFKHYFKEKYLERPEIFKILCICSFLDPRFKDLLFLENEDKIKTIDIVKDMFEQI